MEGCRVGWVALVAALLQAAPQATAQPAPPRHNWFGDPFFQVSDHIAGCPEPAGPRLTERERRVRSHERAERGTTCWLAGQCDRHSAYAYDADIAQAAQAALKARHPAPRSTLWLTVQRRIVFIEGCVASERDGPRLEAYFRRLPDVERAVAIVHVMHRGSRPPYRLLSAPDAAAP